MKRIIILGFVCLLSACAKQPRTCAEMQPTYDNILQCASDDDCTLTWDDARVIHDYVERCLPKPGAR